MCGKGDDRLAAKPEFRRQIEAFEVRARYHDRHRLDPELDKWVGEEVKQHLPRCPGAARIRCDRRLAVPLRGPFIDDAGHQGTVMLDPDGAIGSGHEALIGYPGLNPGRHPRIIAVDHRSYATNAVI